MSDTPTTPPTGTPRYTIGELAERAGVSRRTVRYYVQRELLPAPDGLGRGAHYGEAHLERLVRIRELQESGVPLADIPAALAPPTPSAPGGPPPRPVGAPTAHLDRWSRAVVADGVELHVRDGALDRATVATLLRLCTEHLKDPSPSPTPAKEKTDDDQ